MHLQCCTFSIERRRVLPANLRTVSTPWTPWRCRTPFPWLSLHDNHLHETNTYTTDSTYRSMVVLLLFVLVLLLLGYETIWQACVCGVLVSLDK